MTQKELTRLEVLVQIKQGKISQQKAAEELHLSERQIQRIYRAYKREGMHAYTSKKRRQMRHHSFYR